MSARFARWFMWGLFWWVGASGLAMAQSSAPVRRFALLIGANHGGADRVALRYAVSDARAVANVLEQLGGVAAHDRLLLVDPDVQALEGAFAEQVARVRSASAAGQRTELFFYYSGHSDERGLRLPGSLLPYARLRAWLDGVPADVRVTVLDSCASGTLTRLKGGAHIAPFLMDESVAVRGHAILTASSGDEAAQESDQIGGSFFTHYFLSGLRGAADTTADGRVTLTEAYRFAFDETLARTGVTRAGAQHPAYDFQLAGTGDLVITDLRTASARLIFDASVEGRLFIRDAAQHLAAELTKRRNVTLPLVLVPGAYEVLVERGGGLSGAQFVLQSQQSLVVSTHALVAMARERTARRGDDDERLVPVGFSLVPPTDTYETRRGRVTSYLGLHALYGEPDVLSGFQFALGGNGARETADGVQLALVANRAGALRGMQLAGAVNAVRGELVGAQLSGLGNLARHTGAGVQVAFGWNGALRLRGGQIAAVSVTRQELAGLQLGALAWATQLRGLQLGGVTMARDVRGLQLGVINVALGDVRGVQLGVINYARSADVGLAPFSVTREGGVHAVFLAGSSALVQTAIRFDARYTYSFFGVALHPLGPERSRAYLFGAGFGGKIPLLRRLFLELDLGAYLAQPLWKFETGLPHALAQARGLLRFELHARASFMAGPTLDVFIETDPVHRLDPGLDHGRARVTPLRSDALVRVAPGWAAGLRF